MNAKYISTVDFEKENKIYISTGTADWKINEESILLFLNVIKNNYMFLSNYNMSALLPENLNTDNQLLTTIYFDLDTINFILNNGK